jgi:hypothetical protein
LVVLHIGDVALDAVASTAFVVGLLSRSRLSNSGNSGIGDLNVVGILSADLSVSLVAAEAAVTLINAMGSLLAVGNILGRTVYALASMPLVATPVVAVARGSVNRVLHDGGLDGSGRRSLDGNCRSGLVFGNKTPVAVEIQTAIVDAVCSLLTGGNLGRSVDTLTSTPTIATPEIAVA